MKSDLRGDETLASRPRTGEATLMFLADSIWVWERNTIRRWTEPHAEPQGRQNRRPGNPGLSAEGPSGPENTLGEASSTLASRSSRLERTARLPGTSRKSRAAGQDTK